MNCRTITPSCIIILILFFADPLYSQLNIKAGFGVSDIVFSDEGQVPYLGYETDYLTHRYPLITYQVGIAWTLRLNDHFNVQPELLFVKQGLNYNMQFTYDEIVNKVYLYYLQVPAEIYYRFALKRKHQPNFSLGPYFGLLINSSRIKSYDGNKTVTDVSNAKPYDFGVVTGFGYEFNLDQGQIGAEIRFGYSLINVMNTIEGYVPKYTTTINTKARNLSMTILVSYRFSKFNT